MADDEKQKFRPRREETGDGLVIDEAARRRRGVDSGLVVVKAEAPVEAVGLQLVPITDRLLSVDDVDPDLVVADDDFGISALLAEQRSERLRPLLERAQALISDGQWRQALPVLQQARAVDSSAVGTALLLVQCLAELGHHEAALRVVSHARSQVTDADARTVLFRREAMCIREITLILEKRLVALAEAGQFDEALRLGMEERVRQPSNIVLLYHLAKLHVLRSDIASAKQATEEARRHTGRDSVDLFAEIERTIEFGPHAAAVEQARQHLRRRDRTSALRVLESCAAALSGGEHFDGLLEYAREPVPAAARGTPSSPPPSTATTSRQQTLRWILAEEIRIGDAATRDTRYAVAATTFANAEAIDAHCGAVCYKHAHVIWLQYKAGAEGGKSVTARNDLARAEALATRALVDGNYRDAAAALQTLIRDVRLPLAGST